MYSNEAEAAFGNWDYLVVTAEARAPAVQSVCVFCGSLPTSKA